MPTATLTSKGQVTIPKEVRNALDLDTGDRVAFVMRDDGVVELRPETTDLLELFGILPSTRGVVSVEEMNAAIEQSVEKK